MLLPRIVPRPTSPQPESLTETHAAQDDEPPGHDQEDQAGQTTQHDEQAPLFTQDFARRTALSPAFGHGETQPGQE